MILEHDPRSTRNIAILRSGEFCTCGNFDLISKKISVPSVPSVLNLPIAFRALRDRRAAMAAPIILCVKGS